MKYLGRSYLLILAALALAVIITVIAYNLFSAAAPDAARTVPVSWGYVTWSPDGGSYAYVLGAYLVGPL